MFHASGEMWKRAVPATLFLALMYVWFVICERTVQVPTYIVYHPLDQRIPFIPQFIVPYYLWYVYISVPIVWLFFVSPEDYVKGVMFLGMALLVSCLVYTIAPNGQRLRPHVLGDGFFERWVAFTYSIDTPNNVSPSLHVLDSIAVHSALTGCRRFRRCRPAVAVSAAVCAACSISTVFVKQHSIFDIFVSIPLGAIIWFGIYGMPKMIKYRREHPAYGHRRRFRLKF